MSTIHEARQRCSCALPTLGCNEPHEAHSSDRARLFHSLLQPLRVPMRRVAAACCSSQPRRLNCTCSRGQPPQPATTRHDPPLRAQGRQCGHRPRMALDCIACTAVAAQSGGTGWVQDSALPARHMQATPPVAAVRRDAGATPGECPRSGCSYGRPAATAQRGHHGGCALGGVRAEGRCGSH